LRDVPGGKEAESLRGVGWWDVGVGVGVGVDFWVWVWLWVWV